jgi:hypothetical protein
MQDALTSNVQSSIRPGMDVDTFYYGDTNSEKQIFNCIVNSKFTQNFQNVGQGTSQFTISPFQGVSDIILNFKMGTNGASTTANLPQAWGYALINQVSVRYGSSAQYFFTGQQMYLQNLFECENGTKRDALSSLGGNALAGTAANNAQALCYLNLPHNSPRVEGKPLPFPSDLLTQPIVITIQLNDPTAAASAGGIWVPGVAGGAVTIPQGLVFAQMQVRQEMMADSADLLARRVDMNTHAYTFPLKYFPQQQVSVNLASVPGTQTVNLTGFRAGEVQRIMMWLTKTSSTASNGALYWQPITDIELTYNGEIFYLAPGTSGALWNLVNDTKTNAVNGALVNTAGAWGSGLSYWYEMPFSQSNVPYDKEIKLIGGKPILNAVVNLKIATPTQDSDYVLNLCYFYNCSLLCSRGGAEYIF